MNDSNIVGASDSHSAFGAASASDIISINGPSDTSNIDDIDIAELTGDSISKLRPYTLDRLRATPGIVWRSKENLCRHASSYMDALIKQAGDSLQAVTPAMHDKFCSGAWINPRTGRPPTDTPANRKMWRHCASRVVRTWRDFGALASDGELVLHVDPPAVADTVQELPEDHPERVNKAIDDWRPRTPLSDDSDTDVMLIGLARSWARATEPPTVSSATSRLRCVADQIVWANDELDTTDPRYVLSPTNVEAATMDQTNGWTPSWRAVSRGILRLTGRAVCPDLWPDEPEVIGVQPATEPYDATDEALFIEAALLQHKAARRERLWLTGAALGAGLGGTEIFAAGPSDIVELNGGRLGIKVHRGRARIIPVRDMYTELVAEARELCKKQPRFFASESEARAYNLAAKFVVAGLGRLYLPRARSTFVCAHIAHGTAVRDLDEICGPIGGTYLRQMMDRYSGSADSLETANRALGP